MINDTCCNCHDEFDLDSSRYGKEMLEQTGMVVLGENMCNDCFVGWSICQDMQEDYDTFEQNEGY